MLGVDARRFPLYTSCSSPNHPVTLSDRLQTKLDSARAQRAFSAQPQPRAFSRLHAIGLGIGLLMGGGAFLYGAQTPSNTLPATPVVAAEPTTDWRTKISEATPADLTQPTPVAVSATAAKPVRCNPYASNGTYLPELCGDHDPFADRAARTSRVPATTDAERIKTQSLSYAAEQLLARCDRDWLPSTCAQMRAELAQ